MLSTANVTLAQTAVKVTTTTTTTSETIHELKPETIIIRTETATEPVRYSYSKPPPPWMNPERLTRRNRTLRQRSPSPTSRRRPLPSSLSLRKTRVRKRSKMRASRRERPNSPHE